MCRAGTYKSEGEEFVGIQILPMMENVREKLGHEPTEEELDAFFKDIVKEFNQKLAVYKRIRAVFVRRTDFVRTTTRKVKRQENPLTEEIIIGYTAPKLEI